MQVLNELEQVRWDEFAQPHWNARDEVPSALRALADTTKSDDSTAYHRLLYAVGNNHSGTYFPVVLPTIPFIGQILEQAQLAARLRALDVLVDLVGSFSPDPAFGQVATSQGLRSLHRLLNEAVRGQAVAIERCRSNSESPEEARLAEELLSLLQD